MKGEPRPGQSGVAYYLWPAIWVGDVPGSPGDPQFDAFNEVVLRHQTAFGSIEVSREGQYTFRFEDATYDLLADMAGDFDERARKILRQTRVLNSHLACLYSAIVAVDNIGFGLMVVTPRNRIVVHESGWGPGNDPLVQQLTLSRFPSTYQPGVPPAADWRLLGRVLISIEAVEAAMRLFDSLLATDERFLALAEILLIAARSIEDHDYSLALTTAWTGCEAVLRLLWQELIDDERERDPEAMDPARRRRLDDGRVYSAAVVLEVLRFVHRIDDALYTAATDTRRERNTWVHSMTPASRQAATQAIDVLESLIERSTAVGLNLPLYVGFHS